MIVGHVGIALGAKGVRARVPMWLLMCAALIPDFVDLALSLTGSRADATAMWSHSIPAIAVLAALLAAAAWLAYRDWRAAALLAGLVVSHVLADYITGHKPTWPGGPVIGLGLYMRPKADFVLEAAVIITGWLVYRRSLDVVARRAPTALALCAFLLCVQLASDFQQVLLPAAHRVVDPVLHTVMRLTPNGARPAIRQRLARARAKIRI